MTVTGIMVDPVEGAASSGLVGKSGMGAGLRPPHVRAAVPVGAGPA